MLLSDIFVRFPAITLCLILIILMARDARQYYQAWLAIGLLGAVIASSLHTMPTELKLPYPIYAIALFLSVPAAALQWCFARSVLEDRFQPGPIDWLIIVIACLFKLGWSLQGIGIVPPAHGFRYIGSYTVNLLMAAHVMWITVSGLQTDLVEPRRRIRYWFVLFMGLVGIVTMAVELTSYSGAVEAILIHMVSLPLLLSAVLWFSKLTPEYLFGDVTEPVSPEKARVPERMLPAFRKLLQFIEMDQGYTDQELTIGKLAVQVGLPEHQLRRLINQALGHRNFATYLNIYRLAYAKTALTDINQAQTPILTIAMDSGYKTLSSFNRAFKESENETPSEFRRRALREVADME